jgi:arginyl-tRNA synthetase
VWHEKNHVDPFAMSTITRQLTDCFKTAIHAAFGVDADPLIGVSQNPQFGDYQSNAAMSLAKTLGQKPREVAEKIKATLNLGNMAQEVTIAGPGFINVKLSYPWLAEELQKLLEDQRLGIEKIAQPRTVVVDYSGPNIAKEMHVGHLRSTIIGDAISRVLEFQGHTIIRQNHIGDWGTQFGMLIRHISQSSFVAHQQINDLEAFYRTAKRYFDGDPKFQEESRQMVVRLQAGDSWALRWWQEIVEETRRHYLPLYELLRVKLTVADERGESAYNSELPGVVAELKKLSLAVESDGATVVFIDGPEKPPLIAKKTDGGYLYATTDLAAVRYRVSQLHAQRIIYVHDSRQAHHFAQVFAVAKKAGWADGVSLEYAPFGTMLGEDGKPFKTRSGGTVKLKELLDEAEERALSVVKTKNPDLPAEEQKKIAEAVGIGAVKYSDLAKDRVADYVFSFDKMLALDGNTAPYLQYAHARIRSIFRKAQAPARRDQSVSIDLNSPFEIALAKHILRLGEVIDLVARDLKPHLLCTYLYDLATKFSGFYENCQVLGSQEEASRLALCQLAARTLEIGLELLGIEHPDRM